MAVFLILSMPRFSPICVLVFFKTTYAADGKFIHDLIFFNWTFLGRPVVTTGTASIPDSVLCFMFVQNRFRRIFDTKPLLPSEQV